MDGPIGYRRVFVSVDAVMVMRVRRNVRMAMRSTCHVSMRMAPTGNHRLRNQCGSEQDRQVGIATHILSSIAFQLGF